MSENTKIEWATHTFNPWEGCTNCYAEARNHRFGADNWGKGKPRRRTSAANWRLPLKWNCGPFICGTCGKPFVQLTGKQKLCEPVPGDPCQNCNFGRYARPRVFCASLADWLDDEVPIEWLEDLLKVIYDTPNLDWQLLSKRPENFFSRITEAQTRRGGIIDKARESVVMASFAVWLEYWRTGVNAPHNVWIGASAEDQPRADERIPELLKIPARVRFLSAEPLLGPIRFAKVPGFNKAGSAGNEILRNFWVIAGGESGPGSRPCNIEWIRDIVRQCRVAGVAPFVKQLGSKPYGAKDGAYNDYEWRAKIAHSKGGDMAEWPEDLRVREFPKNL